MEYQFEFQLDLRRMAIQAVALSLWNRPDIQFKLKRCLCFQDTRTIKLKFKELIKEVISNINQEKLPSSLYYELLPLVKSVGKTMRSWFNCLKRNKIFQNFSRSQIYENLFSTIYWTHYGTIDEEKIFRRFWLKNKNIDIRQAYVVACRHCLVDVIDDLWKKISYLKRIIFNYKDLNKILGFHLVLYWNKFRENDLDTFQNYVILKNLEIYERNKSLNWNMATLSMVKGYVSAFKFFWNKMSLEERYETATGFMSSIDSCSILGRNVRQYRPRKRQYIEILAFLLNFLSKHREKVFSGIDETRMNESSFISCFSGMIIGKYPWQEFFPTTINILRSEFKKDGCSLEKLTNRILKDSKRLGIPACRNKLQALLQMFWQFNPDLFKPTQFQKEYLWDKLFATEDFIVIKMILMKNKYVSSNFPHVLQEGNDSYLTLLSAKTEKKEIFPDILKLSIFISMFFPNEITIYRELDKNVQEYLKSIYKSILEGDEEGFTSLPDEYNGVNIKEEIDANLINLYLVTEEQYQSADVFLKWKFNDPKKIRIFKSRFFDSEKMIIARIYDFWRNTPKENIGIAKTRSENFLRYVFESDEDISLFKTENLVQALKCGTITSELMCSFDGDDTITYHNFEIFEEYFSWCSLNSDNVNELKRSILASDHYGLMITLNWYMKHQDIETAGKFLSWAFDSEDEKKTFMNDFLASEGHKACIDYIEKVTNWKFFNSKHTTEEVTEKYKRFIELFIRPYSELTNFNKFICDLKMDLIWDTYASDDSSDRKSFSDCPAFGAYNYRNEKEEKNSYAYCIVENYDLFLSLLDSLKLGVKIGLKIIGSY